MILQGNCLNILSTIPTESVSCCITSPPYWGLRDYGTEDQLGLEPTPEEYVTNMVKVFSEVRRVLKKEGTLWLNLGDSYAANRSYQVTDNKHVDVGNKKSSSVPVGLKPKDLVGIPWLVAFALRADGWYLRQDIIWHKPNPMPESVKDRCTKAHEYVFLMSKSKKYYYDSSAIKEKSVEPIRQREKNNGESAVDTKKRGFSCNCGNSGFRNKRSVWSITTKPYKGAHFAVFPEALVEPCLKAGCPEGETVLDPFFGSGTVGEVALQHGREYIGIELNPEYCKLSERRIMTGVQV